MTRRRFAPIALIIALLLAGLGVPLPAGASHQRDANPADIPPASLKLPASALPAGSIIDHDGVSDNQDADGNGPDKAYPSQLRIIHQNLYEVLGRITGYRQDFRYQVQGNEVGTEYLVSIFPTPAKAQAAMTDAIGDTSLIHYIGKPLQHQCTVGDSCAAYYGPQPGTPDNAVAAIFVHGPILVETASHVPADQFTALEPAMETILYGLLTAADAQITLALGTAAATATPQPTATKTVKPIIKCPKNSKKKGSKCTCKTGYKMKKGKCVKKK